MKRVTIQDIANELGVSRNTVSKAINNGGSLAEATRERVLRKAVEMGYKHFSYLKTHNGVAAGYGNPEKGEISLLRGDAAASSGYIRPMLDRIKKELPRYGYRLTARQAEPGIPAERALPSAAGPGRTAAFLCVGMFDRAYDEMFCSLGLPVLFVDGPSKRGGADLPADQLYMDSTTPVARFVSDMLARGRRRIGFIGDWDRCQSLYERYAAFRCAMLMESAPVEKRFCIRTEVPEEIGSALASLSDFPDVFICSDDRTAAEAVGALGRLGRSVPEDVAVCGFGDSPDSRVMAPALTTVHIHTGVMAHAAVQMLLSRIEEPGMDYRIVHTETGLVYRDSAVK